MKSLFLFLSLLVPLVLQAGSSDAIISGKSASGRTTVKILVRDLDGQVPEINFSIDGESYTLKDPESFVVRDQKRQVYTIAATQDEKQVIFYLIPGTETVLDASGHRYRSKFQAIIQGTEPRPNQELQSKKITLFCTLDYSL